MCQFFYVSRSGYYDFVHRIDRSELDAGLGELLKEQQIISADLWLPQDVVMAG